jgi:hypothetical protein
MISCVFLNCNSLFQLRLLYLVPGVHLGLKINGFGGAQQNINLFREAGHPIAAAIIASNYSTAPLDRVE